LRRRQLLDDRVDVEARRLLPRRELLERLQPLCDYGLRWNDEEEFGGLQLVHGFIRALEGVRAQIEDFRRAKGREFSLPDAEALVLAVDEVEGCGQELFIDGLHALLRQRTGVLDLAIGHGFEDATRTEPLAELWILRVLGVFRLFLGVEVVEIADRKRRGDAQLHSQC